MIWRPALLLVLVVAVVAVTSWSLRDPVHSEWEDRESLPSCGRISLEQGERLRVRGADQVACLREALGSGAGAELVVTYPTIEGDPITDYYRVLSTGSTEFWTDATQDAFGSGGWEHASCDNPSGPLDVNC